jgi:hypothetical protein
VPTDTIRDLILDGYEISIHCRAYPCTNRAKVDLAAVARKHGLDWEWFGRSWPYGIAASFEPGFSTLSRCSTCSSSTKRPRPERSRLTGLRLGSYSGLFLYASLSVDALFCLTGAR